MVNKDCMSLKPSKDIFYPRLPTSTPTGSLRLINITTVQIHELKQARKPNLSSKECKLQRNPAHNITSHVLVCDDCSIWLQMFKKQHSLFNISVFNSL